MNDVSDTMTWAFSLGPVYRASVLSHVRAAAITFDVEIDITPTGGFIVKHYQMTAVGSRSCIICFRDAFLKMMN